MKKLLCLLLALVMVFSLAACGGDKDKTDEPDTPVVENDNTRPEKPDDDDVVVEPSDDEDEDEGKDDADNVIKTDKFTIPETDAEVEGTVEMAARTADKFALNYVFAIANNHYTAALDAFKVDGTPFMSANDIKYSAPRSALKNLINHAGKEVFLAVNTDLTNSSDGKATVYVDLQTDDKTLETFEVKVAMNADNVWYVVDDTYYIKDFYVLVPGNTELTVDGIAVSDDLFVEDAGYNTLADLYKLPVIGRSEKEFKVACANFEYTIKHIAEANDKENKFDAKKELDEEKLNAALDATKNIWNNMYNEWVENKDVDLTKYFSKTSSPDYPANVKAGFAELRKASSYEDIDHHISIIQKRPDASCFYVNDKVIILNFQYQLDWVWDFSMGGPESSRRFSHILLVEEDGEYKIFEISDSKLFNEEYGKDW